MKFDNGICFEKLPKEAIIHYYDYFSDWSWGASLLIYELDGKYYKVDDLDLWEAEELSAEKAIQEIIDFEGEMS